MLHLIVNECVEAMDTITYSRSDQEGMDELRYMFHCVKFELESTRIQFMEEKSKSEETVKQIMGHLETALKEREEAKVQLRELQSMFLPSLSGQTPRPTTITMSQVQAHSSTPFFTTPSNEIQQTYAKSSSSQVLKFTSGQESFRGNSSNNMIDSRNLANPNGQVLKHLGSNTGYDYASYIIEYLCMGKLLPEKGKLLHSVKDAGPLLDNLLIAGPVPKWKYPPNPLQALNITTRPIRRSLCGRVETKAAEISQSYHASQHASNASCLRLSLGSPQEPSSSVLYGHRGYD